MAKRPPAARTAFGPTMFAAVEQYFPETQRITEDELAIRFLPPGIRLLTWMCKWRFPRTLIGNGIERQIPGIWGSMAARKRYADDKVTEALDAGIGQVVILGAGLDTRAYRLVAPAGVPAFEVDLPSNIAYKERRLRAIYGREPEHVTLIPVDFETDSLADSLTTNGFRLEKSTMFVWEAVTQYLTEDGIRRTLAFLAKAAAGSRLIFTYVRKDFLDGKNFYGFEKGYREWVVKQRMWRFGIDPEDVDDLLREYGWTEREQVGPSEYVARYFRPAGRDLTASEIERFVYAEKL
ncbi:MAG: SAM-dependent methyltransferase [Streptosporangiales bacterium]|nr:SAM-dependent methyltransferase [Streptosporangiales bacterium]